MRPFPNQISLELRQRREHMKNQLARCAAGFDFLSQTFKRDTALLKIGHDLHQVRQTASKSIQPPDNEGIPSPQRLAALLKLGPVGRLAAGRFFVNQRTTCLLG